MAASGSPAYCRALVQRLRISSSSSSQQAEAAAKLASLVQANAAAAEAAVVAGAIPALLQLLKGSSSAGSVAARSRAVSALASLCMNEPARLRQLLQPGGVDALLPLLPGRADVSHLGTLILGSMAAELPDAKQQLGAAALMPLLSLLRASDDHPVLEAALAALDTL